jgi:hypothetical protein
MCRASAVGVTRESNVANTFQAGLFLEIVLKKGPATRLPHVSRQCGWRDSRESDVANTFGAGLFLEIVFKKGSKYKKKIHPVWGLNHPAGGPTST